MLEGWTGSLGHRREVPRSPTNPTRDTRPTLGLEGEAFQEFKGLGPRSKPPPAYQSYGSDGRKYPPESGHHEVTGQDSSSQAAGVTSSVKSSSECQWHSLARAPREQLSQLMICPVETRAEGRRDSLGALPPTPSCRLWSKPLHP